jgi:Reverse transcriptase (RNA-dependent DNA polymerase)
LFNITACTNRNKTPSELFLGKVPCMAPVKVPGCLGYVMVPKEKRHHKFQACSVPGVLLGYEPHSKGYMMLVKQARGYKVVISRDVVFDEETKGYPVLQDARYSAGQAPLWIADGDFSFPQPNILPLPVQTHFPIPPPPPAFPPPPPALLPVQTHSSVPPPPLQLPIPILTSDITCTQGSGGVETGSTVPCSVGLGGTGPSGIAGHHRESLPEERDDHQTLLPGLSEAVGHTSNHQTLLPGLSEAVGHTSNHQTLLPCLSEAVGLTSDHQTLLPGPGEEGREIRNQAQEQIPIRNQIQEQVPTRNQIQEQVPIRNQIQEQVPIRNQAQEQIPIRNQIQEQVPIRNPAQEQIPTRDQVQEHVSIRNTCSQEDRLWNRHLRHIAGNASTLMQQMCTSPRLRKLPDRLTYLTTQLLPIPEEGNAGLHVPYTESDNPSVKDALSGPNKDLWWDAIYDEYLSLLSKGTWEETVAPPRANILPCKWVLTVKRDALGGVEKYKARLVVCGNMQREGIDYEEVFAPTSRYSTLRVFLAVVADQDMEMEQLDVKTAFLNGDLEEEVYMRHPKLFESQIPGVVCRLQRALYGLKQAPRQWRKVMERVLVVEMGFKESPGDPGLFFRFTPKGLQLLLTWVDDFLMAALTLQEIAAIKQALMRHFECRELGEPKSFLSMQIIRDRSARTIKINQPKLVEEVLAVVNMSAARKVTSPLDPGVKLLDTGRDLDTSKHPYETVLGKLLYLSICTRPDIVYAVNQLARYSAKPTLEHWQSLIHVCRYIFHSRNLGITYGRKKGLRVYTDSDFANCPISSKSTSGFVATLAGGAIAWSSKRQSITAQSSTEAEFIATNHAVMETDHLRKVLWSCGLQVTPINMMCDNSGAIAQAKGVNTTDKRMKHVAIRYNQNVADCMTKPVRPAVLKMATEGMGMSEEPTV